MSNFNVDQVQRAAAIAPVTSLQPPYSMLERDAENELLSYCAKQGMAVVAYSPLQKGLLTGKVTKAWVEGLPADDHRKTKDPMFQEPELARILDQVEAIRAIADRHEITLSQLALAWVLRRPEVTSAIVGGRRPDQIRETAQAMDVALSADDLAEIERKLG